MLVFLSYQTDDKLVAAEVSKFFKQFEFETFMAHEHIEVSHEWQDTIMEKINDADIFVAILTERYLTSHFCLQESGIAVFCEEDLTIIPLSVDKTLPPGFMKHIQAKKYEPGGNNDAVLFAGIANSDDRYAIDLLIERLEHTGTYAMSEKWFGILWNYIGRATPNQKLDILNAANTNPQFSHAWGCKKGLRELFDKHGYRLDDRAQNYLDGVLS